MRGLGDLIHGKGVTKAMRVWRSCGFMASSRGKVGEESRKMCNGVVRPKENAGSKL